MIKTKVEWIDDTHCKLGDVNFQVETGQDLYMNQSLDELQFVIGKSKRMLNTLVDLPFSKPVRNICEIGIYKGGSAVFYHKLFDPMKIVAIELNEDPVPVEALTSYIKSNSLENTIRTYYGVDQSDRAKIDKILNAEMPDQYFDLIIDDASHFLDQTRESFNILFPYLAPEGYYIIEDWGWAHWDVPRWQDNGGPWKDKEPLTNLIFELTMFLASRPDLVESVYLLPAYAIIKKTSASKNHERSYFDLSKSYKNRGKRVTLLK